MGCDIHMYVEYRQKGTESTRDAIVNWRLFGGRINPGRWYDMFEVLAGVRGSESKAVVAPRGIPSDIGWNVRDDNECWIDYDAASQNDVSEGHCLPSRAVEWVRSGSSTLVDPKDIAPCEEVSPETDDGGTVADMKTALRGATRVTHPAWHSHSWLTTEEYARAIRLIAKPSQAAEYYAILAAMRQLEVGGNEARVVFWFDN